MNQGEPKITKQRLLEILDANWKNWIEFLPDNAVFNVKAISQDPAGMNFTWMIDSIDENNEMIMKPYIMSNGYISIYWSTEV